MSLFGTEVVLFSPIQGKLTYQGHPAANAKIVRHLIWKDEIGEKENFYANKKGEFNLPIKIEKIRIPLLGEFVMSQEIWIYYKDQEFAIWGRSKRSINKYGEMGGEMINFRCELTETVRSIEIADGLFGTSCIWDSISKKGI